jgi:hypothetical protein
MRRKKNIDLEVFDKRNVVEKDLIDKVSLWMLRILVKLGASKQFIDKDNNIRDDETTAQQTLFIFGSVQNSVSA